MAQVQDKDVIIEGNEVVLLRGKKLRKLLKQVREDEINLFTRKMTFNSELDKEQLLRESREAYLTARSLVKQKFEHDDPVPEGFHYVVEKYLSWVEVAVGFGIMVLQNLKLRLNYLRKLRTYGDGLVHVINGLQRSGTSEEYIATARVLVKGFVGYENYTLGCMVSRAGHSSKLFARAFHVKGETFRQLTQRHYLKLAEAEQLPAGKAFEELTDTQKLEVYSDIVNSWGNEALLDTAKLKVLAASAIGLLLFTAGMTVYDVVMSKHPWWQTVTKEVAEFGAGYVGGDKGELVAKYVSTAMMDSEVIASSTIVSGLLGAAIFVVGTVAGFYAAYATGYVIENIQAWFADKHIESGGKHMDPPEGAPDVSFYRAPFPDSVAMARRLAYPGES